jgi:DNA gyrase subunit B
VLLFFRKFLQFSRRARPKIHAFESRKNTTMKPEKEYTADDIITLKGLEHVRHRPGMYVGGTDLRALHFMIEEMLQDFVDEFLEGVCTRIDITIHADGSLTFRSNGCEVPLTRDKRTGVSHLEIWLTTLSFGCGIRPNRRRAGDVRFLDSKIAVALSEWFQVEIFRDGHVHELRFERSKTTRNLSDRGPSPDPEAKGLQFSFKPDPQIFQGGVAADSAQLRQRLHELACLHPPLAFTFIDEREPSPTPESINHPRGLEELIEMSNLDQCFVRSRTIVLNGSIQEITVQIAFQCTAREAPATLLAFTNDVPNSWGGTHVAGFRAGLVLAVKYLVRQQSPKPARAPKISTQHGCSAVIALQHPNPHREGPTPMKLCSPDAEPVTRAITHLGLLQLAKQDSQLVKTLLAHFTSAS